MDCEKIQELIITDYSDGEASQAVKEEVQRHLGACNRCRELERALRDNAVEPFRKAREFKPADSVWHRIEEAIALEEAQRSGGLPAYLRGLLQGAYYLQRTRLAVTTAAIAVIIIAVAAGVPFYQQRRVSSYVKGQIAFISNLHFGLSGDPYGRESWF